MSNAISRVLLALVLVSASVSYASAKSFDVDNPEHRARWIAFAFMEKRAGKVREAAGMLYRAVLDWTSEEQQADREKACQYLFLLMLQDGQQEHQKGLLESCPASLLSEWYGTQDLDYKPIVKVAPVYPESAARYSIKGTVTVVYDVNARGTTENIRVLESSDKLFDESAIEAAAQFHYLPARKNGEFIATKDVKNRFRFNWKR